jgi:hypothetical protein
MELSAPAGPGVEKAAERAVEVACDLADLAGVDDWSTAAAEDVLDATDILTDTLGGAGAELTQTLAVVPAATTGAPTPGHRYGCPGARAKRCGVGAPWNAAVREGLPSAAGSVRAPEASVRTAECLIGFLQLRDTWGAMAGRFIEQFPAWPR